MIDKQGADKLTKTDQRKVKRMARKVRRIATKLHDAAIAMTISGEVGDIQKLGESIGLLINVRSQAGLVMYVADDLREDYK